MSVKFTKRTESMIPSGIRALNERALAMERKGEKIYHFDVGRPDFDTPEFIKNACIASLKSGDVFYTSSFGTDELRKEIAGYLTIKKHIPTCYDEVLVTVGISEAVFISLSALLDAGDEILVPDPVWMNYINVPRFLGAVPVTYSMLEENGYQPDPDEIRQKVTDRTKAIVLISPHNPTGSIAGRKVLEAIAEIAMDKDLAVISDEVYDRIVYDGNEHVSIASIPGMKERTITLNGWSKAFSMTGWRIGYLSAPADWVQMLNKIHQVDVTCAPSFVQKAAITVIREEKDEFEKMLKEYERRRNYAVAEINAIPGISCIPPQGTFYLFLNIRKLGISSGRFSDHLLQQEKVAIVPGDVFGTNGKGYMRMSFANNMENIEEGIRRLKRAVAQL